MLQIVDAQWKDHLYSLDHLKEGIGLRGYGQRDPLIEYKKESFALFQAMKERVDEEIVRYLWWLRPILNEEAPVARRPAARRPPPLILNDPGRESTSVLGAARRRRRRRARLRGLNRSHSNSSRPAWAATMRSRRRCGATSRRSAVTTRARAAAGRSTRNVTGRRLTRNHQAPVTTRHSRPTFVGLLFI
jgi:hypothetical protein